MRSAGADRKARDGALRDPSPGRTGIKPSAPYWTDPARRTNGTPSGDRETGAGRSITRSAPTIVGVTAVLLRLAAAVALCYGVATASYPALFLPSRIARGVVLAVCCSVLFFPLLV